jgi:hypothetical protein
MAKRFTDTNKYRKPFIRGLPGPYKLFWDYLYHDCDHAGIWIVDFEIAQIYVGADMPINQDEALTFFNNGEQRIIEFDEGKKWFLKPFIEFQYGELNESNRAHNSVIQILRKNQLLKPLTSPLQGAEDKVKDKDMVKDKYRKEKSIFEEARKLYPGQKRGTDIEFQNFTKKNRQWKDVLTLLKLAIEQQKETIWRDVDKKFIPHFSTWINQKRWELEGIPEKGKTVAEEYEQYKKGA